MDVNGFMYRLKQCLVAEEPENIYKPQLVKYISMETFAEGFKMHSYWNDILVKDSILNKFLQDEIVDEFTHKLCVHKLRDLGLLWCDGGKTEKSVELFENILPGLAINISSHDKNF